MNNEILTQLLIVLDFALIAYIAFNILVLIRGTRATPMLIGLSILVGLYFASNFFGFIALRWVLGHFFSSLILFFVVIFQEEIRRGLTKFGLNPFFRRTDKVIYDKTIEDITLVVTRLAEKKLGALIVIQREVGLEDFVEDSVFIDALLNRKLLYSLFVKESSLHDGAVIIEGNRIRAAGCVLPLSYDPNLDPNLGTRHRAAVGISEKSDAVVLVVSEENGAISIARDGKIMRNLDGSKLRESLSEALASKPEIANENKEAA